MMTREAAKPSAGSLSLLDEMTRAIGARLSGLHEWFQEYAMGQRRRIAFDIDHIVRKATKSSKILEIGSAPFLLTAALQKLGYDIQGVDIEPDRFRPAIDFLGLSVKKCDIESEELPFADESFDIVLFFEVFEHLRINPIFSMREVLRVLKPGGALMLSTPNLRSIDGIASFLFRGRCGSQGDVYEEYDKLRVIGHMGHVRVYTASEVTDFLNKIELEVKEIVWRGHFGKSRTKRRIVRFFPQLRPFMMIISTKKDGSGCRLYHELQGKSV